MNLHQHIKLMNVPVYYFYCNLHVYQAPLDIIKPRSDRRFYYMLQQGVLLLGYRYIYTAWTKAAISKYK